MGVSQVMETDLWQIRRGQDALDKQDLKARLENGSRVAGVDVYLMDPSRRDLLALMTRFRD